jgi:hypothetical protein
LRCSELLSGVAISAFSLLAELTLEKLSPSIVYYKNTQIPLLRANYTGL